MRWHEAWGLISKKSKPNKGVGERENGRVFSAEKEPHYAKISKTRNSAVTLDNNLSYFTMIEADIGGYKKKFSPNVKRPNQPWKVSTD